LQLWISCQQKDDNGVQTAYKLGLTRKLILELSAMQSEIASHLAGNKAGDREKAAP
jgi:hypothetical protein